MSHLYILQVVCLAFMSPISAFLEGWSGGGVAAAFPYCRLPAPLRQQQALNCRAKFPLVFVAFR